MKQVTFTYIDAKNKQTNRVVLAVEMPRDSLLGYDVGDISEDARKAFSFEIDKLKQEFAANMAEIAAAYDLKHSLRMFKESGMSNKEVTDVS